MSSFPPEVRAPLEDEAETVAALLNAYERRLYDTDAVTADEVRRWWDTEVDRDADVRVAGPEGSLSGYADVASRGPRWWVDLRSLSADAAAALLEWAERRAGRPVRVWACAADGQLAELLRDRGYHPIRSSYRMSIELGDELPPAPEWPAGITVRTFEPGEERAVYEAQEEAFADHWEFTPQPYDSWEQRQLLSPRFDPGLWFLALGGGQIAGLALCFPEASGDPKHGWVGELGVRRAWRRRGVGSALVRHVFREFHRRGCRRVSLGVDAENTTGAVRLYERVGMHVVRRNDSYELR